MSGADPEREAAPWPPQSGAIGLDAYRRMLRAEPTLVPAPSTLAWEAGGDRIVALAWARAVLWQLAHPVVARALAEHSAFDAAPASRLARYERTRKAQIALAFGSPEAAWATAQHIDAIHGRIHGEITLDGASRRYSARDPDLLAWVYATLVDSTLAVFRRFVRPVGRDEAEAYLRQASALAPMLGAPRAAFPARLAELDRLWRATEPTLRVTGDARAVGRDLLLGLPIPVVGPALNAAGRRLLAGLLPPWMRRAYGLPWGGGERALFAATTRVSRGAYRRLPARVRRWPEAR